jgi:hypothetical protein
MKKHIFGMTALWVAAASLMLLVSSCSEKEGVYNPKKKIVSVYESSLYHDYEYPDEDEVFGKSLSEQWVWSGDIPQQIKYYWDGTQMSTEKYAYDKDNRVVSVEASDWDGNPESRMDYEYDGNLLSKCKLYYGGELEREFTFTYNGKTLNSMKCKVYATDDKSGRKHFMTPLRSLGFDKSIAKPVEQRLKKFCSEAKGTEEFDIAFEWTGKNVTALRLRGNGTYCDLLYEYDQNVNPKKGLLGNYFEQESYCSANNVTKYTETEYGETEVVEYSYEYDGKYPSTKQWTERDEYGYEQYTEYYVYE